MEIFNQILNNPSIITAVITICLALLTWLAHVISSQLEKSKNGRKILEGYKLLCGRLPSDIGQKIKECKSVSDIQKVVESLKKVEVKPEVKVEEVK